MFSLSTIAIIISSVLFRCRPSRVHWWAPTGVQEKGTWLTTGAGVTSAPLMPVGSPTAAPSLSRCTYVWPLLLWPPLCMDPHSCPASPGYDLLLFSGCVKSSLWSLGPASFFKEAGNFGRTATGSRVDSDTSVSEVLCCCNDITRSIITSLSLPFSQGSHGIDRCFGGSCVGHWGYWDQESVEPSLRNVILLIHPISNFWTPAVCWTSGNASINESDTVCELRELTVR